MSVRKLSITFVDVRDLDLSYMNKITFLDDFCLCLSLSLSLSLCGKLSNIWGLLPTFTQIKAKRSALLALLVSLSLKVTNEVNAHKVCIIYGLNELTIYIILSFCQIWSSIKTCSTFSLIFIFMKISII